MRSDQATSVVASWPWLQGLPELSICVCALSCFSRVWLFSLLWTIACQAPLSMGFSWQEYWGGLSCLSLGDLPDPVIKPGSPAVPAWQMDSLPLSHQGCPSELRWMPNYCNLITYSFSSFFLFSWFLSFYFALVFFVSLNLFKTTLNWSIIVLVSAVH